MNKKYKIIDIQRGDAYYPCANRYIGKVIENIIYLQEKQDGTVSIEGQVNGKFRIFYKIRVEKVD